MRRRIDNRLRVGAVVAVAALLSLAAACTSTSGATPVIDSIEATSGPAGSVVLLRGTAFGLSEPDVRFDGTAVDAEGSDTRALFTVPYTASTGSHDVTVVFDGNTSAPVQFEVTGPASGNAPSLDGASVRYQTLGPAGAETAMNVVVFGDDLDTETTLSVDGAAVTTFHPARPLGSILDAFAIGYVLQGLPVERFGNVLAARLTQSDGNLPALGSSISVVATNSNGSSAPLTVAVPDQDVLVEFDRIADAAVTWPPAGVWRTSTVNTLSRIYTDAGVLVDQRLDDTVTDPNSGAAFSNADVTDFRDTTRDLDDDVFAGEWFFHVSLVDTRVEPNPGFVTFGRMDDTTDRSGMVVFVGNVGTDARYLRTLSHEMGHGLNLSHCEGDGTVTRSPPASPTPNGDGTTIMNQTRNLATAWQYQFSNASSTHLTTHPANEVTPGAGNMAFNSSSRQEGQCDY